MGCVCSIQEQISPSLFAANPIDITIILVSLITLWLVHRLTRSREKEKYVFDLCKSIESCANQLSDFAFTAWSADTATERMKAVAQTISQIQMLGALVNRLEILTDGWRMRWKAKGPGAVNTKISLGRNVMRLRQSLTEDPFNDPNRPSDVGRAINSTSDVSKFILDLDLGLRNWIKPF